MDCVYCQPYWLFCHGTTYNPWGTTGLNDWKQLSHIMWRRVSYMSNEQTGDNRRSVALKHAFLKKTNFWQNVLERLMNVTLMLAKCNLPLRGSSEELSKDNKSNFFSIIQLLAKYDTGLEKLLLLPKGSPKYLSPLIQIELISVLAEDVLRDIKGKLQNAPFFAIILDTIQDVIKKNS